MACKRFMGLPREGPCGARGASVGDSGSPGGLSTKWTGSIDRSAQPATQPVESFADLLSALGEGEADELVAAAGVEVDAGCGGHAGLVEQAQVPGVGVVGEMAD